MWVTETGFKTVSIELLIVKHKAKLSVQQQNWYFKKKQPIGDLRQICEKTKGLLILPVSPQKIVQINVIQNMKDNMMLFHLQAL